MKKKSRVLASILAAAAVVAAVAGVQVVNADSEKVYVPSSYGETAVYKVDGPRTFGDILGMDASDIDHICVLAYGDYFTISDPAQVEDFVTKLSNVEFQHLSSDPGMCGGTYTLLIFPKDGKGYLQIGDGGSGKILNEDGAAFPVEDGNYQIEEDTIQTWWDVNGAYYNAAQADNALTNYAYDTGFTTADFYAAK